MQTIVTVGSHLEPDVTAPEGVSLAMFTGEPVRLTIALGHPHELEIQAVTAAPTRFAWIDGEHAGVLAYRLGPIMPWAQVAYTPHESPAERGRPGVDADPLVQIVLVDSDTSTVRALAEVRWPVEFAATVRASVARMRELPYSRISYQHVLAGLHRRYPTPEDLVLDRADAQCTAIPSRAG